MGGRVIAFLLHGFACGVPRVRASGSSRDFSASVKTAPEVYADLQVKVVSNILKT